MLSIFLVKVLHILEAGKLKAVGTAMGRMPGFDSWQGQEIFPFPRAFRATRAEPASCPMGARGAFPAVKQSEHKVGHSLPSSAPTFGKNLIKKV
jgi:hypothetical protein